jgi:hypothetical protein
MQEGIRGAVRCTSTTASKSGRMVAIVNCKNFLRWLFVSCIIRILIKDQHDLTNALPGTCCVSLHHLAASS